jgi:hypothetical protein
MLPVWRQPQHRARIAGQNLQDAATLPFGLPARRGVLAAPLRVVPTAKLIDAEITAGPARVRVSMPWALPTPCAGQSFSGLSPATPKGLRGDLRRRPRQGGAPAYVSAGGISKGE